MGFEFLLLVILSVLTFIATVMCVIGLIHMHTGLGTGGLAILVFSILLIIGLISDWEKRTVDHAAEFFSTRDTVYKCEGLKPLQCDYKLKAWRSDSVMWADRVRNIMEVK